MKKADVTFDIKGFKNRFLVIWAMIIGAKVILIENDIIFKTNPLEPNQGKD